MTYNSYREDGTIKLWWYEIDGFLQEMKKIRRDGTVKSEYEYCDWGKKISSYIYNRRDESVKHVIYEYDEEKRKKTVYNSYLDEGDVKRREKYYGFDGKLTGEIYYEQDDEELHREGDLPAEIEYFYNGEKKRECYYKDGEIHREGDLPAEIEYFVNGKKKSEYYYKDGELHRECDLPACIEYDYDGKKKRECYYKDGELHREGDRPAIINYLNGVKIREFYSKNGMCHREGDLPAIILYSEREVKTKEEKWMFDEKIINKN